MTLAAELGFMAALARFPIATVSSAAFWILMLALLLPRSRERITGMFAHPRSARQPYSASLEAFRGLAATLVALAHCMHFTYPIFDYGRATGLVLIAGVKAVPMFAALSGYLIYRAVRPIASVEDLKAYALRRLLRIYPLYLFAVLIALLAGQMIAHDGRFGGVPLFMAELLMLRTIGFPVYANPVAWSLYVEMLFYIVLPVFVLIIGRERVLPAAALALLAFLVADQIPNREFQLWKFFLFGLIAAELSIRFPNWPRRAVAPLLFALGAALIMIDLGGRRTDWLFQLGLTREAEIGFTPALGLGLFVVFLALPALPLINRIAEWFPLRLLGIVSYSIFLMHPFYILANFQELLFVKLGQQTTIWQAYPHLPASYLLLGFFPGIVAWACVTYLAIEKPASRWVMRRNSAAAS